MQEGKRRKKKLRYVFNETLKDSRHVWKGNRKIDSFNSPRSFGGWTVSFDTHTCVTCKILKLFCCWDKIIIWVCKRPANFPGSTLPQPRRHWSNWFGIIIPVKASRQFNKFSFENFCWDFKKEQQLSLVYLLKENRLTHGKKITTH